jgi:hypothetical protein
VIESLEPYKNNAQLAERLAAVLDTRADRELSGVFKKRWSVVR